MLSQKHRIIEALLFTANEPLTSEQANLCLQEEIDLDQIVTEINDYYEQEGAPVWVQNLAEGYRLMTRSEYNPWISRLYQNKGKLRLSRPALETLSIIAYKQPVTRNDIDSIRGVTTTLKPLLEKNLIEIKGRQEGPGRALLYGTSSYFLEYFGLNSIKDIPKIKEIEEIIGDEPSEIPDEGNPA